jgi:Tetracyclin repressor-like, C-terminal domain
MLRYIMRVPPLSDLSVDEVVALVGPTVHRYLTADAGQLGLPA